MSKDVSGLGHWEVWEPPTPRIHHLRQIHQCCVRPAMAELPVWETPISLQIYVGLSLLGMAVEPILPIKL